MKPKLLFIFLCILYFFTRLYNLTLLPIFNDESLYLYWTKIIASTHRHWFLPLIDGKGPTFIWTEVLSMSLFPAHMYLFAGRFVSVLAGLISCIGIYKLSIMLIKKQYIGFLAVLFYIFIPFSLLYDRVALFDSLLTASVIWVVYYAVQTAHSLQLKHALLWGLWMGIAFSIKFNALIIEVLALFIFLIFIGKEHLQKNWKKAVVILLIILPFPIMVQVLLSFSSGYSEYMYRILKYTNHASKSSFPIFSFNLFLHNMLTIFSWLFSYLTPFFFLFAIFSLIITCIINRKLGIFCLSFTIVPIVLISLVNREIAPRYVLFIVPFLIIASCWLIVWMFEKSRPISILITSIIFIFFIRFDYLFMVNPVYAPLPTDERQQFITNDPAGYGLKEIFAYIKSASTKNKITVVTLGTEGLFPYAFNLEFWDNPHVTIVPLWPVDNQTKSQIQSLKRKSKVFVVIKNSSSSQDYSYVKSLSLHIILVSQKPGNVSSIILAQPNK